MTALPKISTTLWFNKDAQSRPSNAQRYRRPRMRLLRSKNQWPKMMA
jgi:hypothetical protein